MQSIFRRPATAFCCPTARFSHRIAPALYRYRIGNGMCKAGDIGNSGSAFLDSGLDEDDAGKGVGWIAQRELELKQEAEMEAEEELLAKKVGLHIRGSKLINLKGYLTDENDKRRFYWHRTLQRHAEQGNYTAAEEVLRDMMQAKHLPGPKAYHALIYSHVKGKNPRGALEALQHESRERGIQPLPESYALVVHGFLQEGDLATAEAVYASNRRAGVRSEKSWRAVTTAFFNAGKAERASELLEQGKQENMLPDKRLYDAMLKCYCRQGNLAAATVCLDEMRKPQAAGILEKDHFSFLVTCHALAGKVEEAEDLLNAMLGFPGSANAASIGALNAVLQMYLKLNLPKNMLAERISMLRQSMRRDGMSLDRKGFSLLLESAVYLDDPQMGTLAFKSLVGEAHGNLQYLSDDVLGNFLLLISRHGLPADIVDALVAMRKEERVLSQETMPVDSSGRTFLTAWLSSAGEEEFEDDGDVVDDEGDDEEGVKSETNVTPISFDGMQFDSETLCCLGPDEKTPMQPSKMRVNQLRAELLVRGLPERGNRKDLIKNVKQARAEAEADYVAEEEKETIKINIKVEEESWTVGELVSLDSYKEERIEEKIEDDEDEGTMIDDDEEERGRRDDDDDEEEEREEDADFTRTLTAMMQGGGAKLIAGDFMLEFPRSGDLFGVREAVDIIRGAIDMGAFPSSADMDALVEAAKGLNDEELQEEVRAIVVNNNNM